MGAETTARALGSGILIEHMDLNLSDCVVAKDENLFLVALRDGRVPAGGDHPLGLWQRDCRYLSEHELRLNGKRLLLLQASDAAGTRVLHHLTNPERTLSVRLELTLEQGVRMRERIVLANHQREPVRLALELRLAADFAPMLAVRGLVESVERRAKRTLGERRLDFSLRGRDGVVRSTSVELGEPPASAEGGRLRFDLELGAGGSHELELVHAVSEADTSARRSAAGRRASTPRAAARVSVRSDDELFDRVLARSLGDLALLRSALDGYPYFVAGLPWYATLYGRDSLIAAMQTLAFDPAPAAGTLRLLGGLLGRELSDARDEEPGKVLHELRVGEPAALGETPFARYYGSADATPLWLCLMCDHADWSGGLDLFREQRGAVDAALAWIERHGDLDGDGLVEYRRRGPHGLVNQGWRDSPDGVPGAAGAPLEPPVALVEVQGYVVRALRRVARLFELDGEAGRARALRARADAVEAALERFWLPGASSYAIGLDAAKRPGSAFSSNPGHLLWAGAVPKERARRVRDALMGDALFSGWGVRTLAEDQPGYNPLGYHTGSVWPHDNALIACGLREYGLDADFLRVFEALLDAASRFNDLRLPELFSGYARTPGEGPVPYPVACRPQAWAAGAIPHLLTAGLGLRPDGLSRRLQVVSPSLPRWLDRVEVEGLRVADASVYLRFERRDGEVTLADARVEGELELVTPG